MVAKSLEDALSQWAQEAGFGEIQSSSRSGSSGWASFSKVLVTKPPAPGASFFCKTSRRSAKEMFEGEALGLQAMYECSKGGRLKIPKVYSWGDYQGGSYLLMEFLNLGGRGDDYSLGQAVAHMHAADPTKLSDAGNPDGRYGFPVDNTIGGTPQPNSWTKGGSTADWVAFFRDHRIGHQLQLAGNSKLSKLWDVDIAPRLDALFEDIEVKPSLLHGDLWSGNIGTANGEPTIYDPAVYWGHHEAEWGMSWCAGFGRDFWEGYRSVIPEEEGFQDRKPLYDAYHQLNHYNLFGGSYLSSAAGELQQVKKILDSKGA